MRLTVQGSIQRQFNNSINVSLGLAGNPYPPLDADGEWLSGYSIKSGYIFTAFSGTGNANLLALGSSPNTPSTGGVDSFTVQGPVRGTGPVRRKNFAQPSYPASHYCGGMQCVIAISGSQTVRLEIGAAQLSLSATPDSVARGTPVTFVASSSQGSLTVLEWQWWPDKTPSNTTTASCGTSATCQTKVYESGTMWVRARTGPNPQTIQAASAAVDAPEYPVVQCPTGDSIVDSPSVRGMLRALMDSSMGHNPRKEFAGALFRDSNGDERWVIDFANPINSCIEARFTPGGLPPLSQLILFAHSHPYSIGDRTCKGGFYAAGRLGGIPSVEDWAIAANEGYPIPRLVIDVDTIAVMRPGSASATEPGTSGAQLPVPNPSEFSVRYSGHSRVGAQCTRP